MVAATPSGISLAPEGGAHQSIGTPLIGMAKPGLASFEPAFVDELAVIMRWGFDYMQREKPEAAGADDEGGGSVYLRLSTRVIEQPQRIMSPELERNIVEGGYWLRRPGPNCELVVAFTGTLAPEAIDAVGLLGEDIRDIGLLATTSADRLYDGWSRAQRRGPQMGRRSHIETLLSGLPHSCGIVTAIDGHPSTLAWLGGVFGHRMRALGVDRFGQTGTLGDLYAEYGIDTNAIIAAAERLGGRRMRHRKASA